MFDLLIIRGVSLIVSGTGLLLIAIAIYMTAKAIAAGFNCTEAIQAKVIAFDSNGSTRTPRIQYEVHGITYTKKNDISSSRHSFDVGDEITVYYNPFNPDEMRFTLRQESGQWIFPLLLFVMGGFCLYFGVLIFHGEASFAGLLNDGIFRL